jgi:hypothetical protein
MTVPVLQAAICGLDPAHPELVTLLFQVPVASAAYLTGLSMRTNGGSLPLTSAAGGTNPNTIVVVLSGGPPYNAVLDVSYAAGTGDWHNSTDVVASFSQVAVTNASKVGTPPSAYPLSTITSSQVAGLGGSMAATVSIAMNPVDAHLTSTYQPQMIDFGGTFGVTSPNPAGVMLPQDLRSLQDGLQVTKQFFVVSQPGWAVIAALDWEVQIKSRIGTALASLRTTDSGISFGTPTTVQV